MSTHYVATRYCSSAALLMMIQFEGQREANEITNEKKK